MRGWGGFLGFWGLLGFLFRAVLRRRGGFGLFEWGLEGMSLEGLEDWESMMIRMADVCESQFLVQCLWKG